MNERDGMHEKDSEFYVIEYLADITRDEKLAIGIILRTPHGHSSQFRSDWSGVKASFPDADIEYMRALGDEIATALASPEPDLAILRWQNALSNNIQMRGPVKCDERVGPDMMNKLIRKYFESDPSTEKGFAEEA